MNHDLTLTATVRTDQGKGASRRLRRTNKVPAILYGGKDNTVLLTLDHNELIKRLEDEAFYSQILTVSIAGKTEEAVLRDLQRHPAKPRILHVDLQRIRQDQLMYVNVRLHFINEEKCVGVRLGGGVLNKILTDVEISCLPKDLPEFLEVDIAELEVGQSIHLSEVKLPPNVTLTALAQDDKDHDTAVVAVHKARSEAEALNTGGEVIPADGNSPDKKTDA